MLGVVHIVHIGFPIGMQTSTLHVIVLLKDCMVNLPTQVLYLIIDCQCSLLLL